MTKKEELLQEIKLRRLIRKALKIRQKKKLLDDRVHLQEENKLRTLIRHLITEGDIDADTNPAPHDSTALSALADAFNQILPVLKTGLRKLKRPEERQSYRAHVLQKFSDMFTNFEGLDTDAEEGAIGESDLNEQEGDVTIKLDDDARVMPSDGGEDERFKEEPAPKLDPDDDDIARLAIETEDPTGARRAFTTINNSNIEKLLSDTRKLLARDEDKEEFKQYAMYNVDLWLLTYEKEIADELGVPPAFDKIVTKKPAGAQTVGAAAQFETEDAPVDDLAAELPVPGGEEAAGDDVDDITSDLEAILMM
jgi:hypothetical protein